MAADEKKKKIESLRKSISNLESQKALPMTKTQLDNIEKIIKNFEDRIRKIKES